jgi:hypothetical protein
LIVGLDVNTHLIAWAIISDCAKIVHIGKADVEHEGGDQLVLAINSAEAIRLLTNLSDAMVCVEVLEFPSSAVKSIRNYRRARWLEGRVLQELGLKASDVVEIPASSEKKAARRRRIELKYHDELDRHLSEDEIDALSVADAARGKRLKQRMLEGVS